MDYFTEASSNWLYSMYTTFCFFFFGFTFFFSVFAFLVFILRLRPWCDCDVCRTYLSGAWKLEFENLSDWYTHLLSKSPTRTVHIHVLRNIVTANPENVEHMLKTRFGNYPKGKPFSAILGDLLGRGIFNVDGDSWLFQRKMASLELGSVSIRTFAFDIVTSEIRNRLIPLMSSFAAGDIDAVVDLQDLFRRFSFDNICRFSFGLDPGCLGLSLPISEFAVAFDLASKLSAERAMTASPLVWKIKRLLNIGSERKLREAVRMVDELAQGLINQRRISGFLAQSDLLSRFMGSISDDRYLRDIVISFVLAGRDTVASALTSFFWLLSQHPEVVSAIREESDRILMITAGNEKESESEPASFEQMRQMHYLQASIHESMRLFPPIQFDSKFSQQDDVLPDGVFVRKGTRVTYHPYAMGRMEKAWGPDCLEFKPERWLKNGEFVPANPFKYPVFQAGPRVCLGKEMAVVEMKTVALALIRQFDITDAAPTPTQRFAPGLTATVRGGFQVRVHRRNRQQLL